LTLLAVVLGLFSANHDSFTWLSQSPWRLRKTCTILNHIRLPHHWDLAVPLHSFHQHNIIQIMDTERARPKEAIAIIGMACRFPGGAHNPEQFFDNLEAGKSAWCEFPSDRLNIGGFYHPSPHRHDSVGLCTYLSPAKAKTLTVRSSTSEAPIS